MIEVMLVEEDLMIRDATRRWVDQELIPLEQQILRADAEDNWFEDDEGNRSALSPEQRQAINDQVSEMGYDKLDLAVEDGGAGVTGMQHALISEELSRTIVPIDLGGEAPNTSMLDELATPEQRENYLEPLKRGEKRSCFMLTEPNAGGDARGIEMRAVRDGDNYVLNGTKIFITGADRSDFAIVMTVTDPELKPRSGFSSFLVDLKDTPGVEIVRPIKTVVGGRLFEVAFQNAVVPAGNLLGEEHNAFKPMQRRLGVRRLQIVSRSIGWAQRAMELAAAWSKQRVTFGQPLSSRQAIQWMLAEAHSNIYASRVMAYDAIRKSEAGQDIRHEVSVIKPFATEMAQKVIDDSMQIHGAAGMTSDLILERMWRGARLSRIYEGPTEVHRLTNARLLLEAY
ncbi:MAG TPA: acyl-CoA dehydrogenase family protein [Dehalococcoidia bacterium]|nr:acyl-CoA dehydrogenase family protein [Dehalococcoidia bacterium]